jgi:type IX secretion system PorP/SprF family membrane protein
MLNNYGSMRNYIPGYLKIILCNLLFIIGYNLIYAQDPYFSQFYANRVYLNPSYAGFDPGTTVTMNYRSQWFGLPDGTISTSTRGYRSFSVSADMQLPCLMDVDDLNMGFAITAFRDDAGNSPLISQGIGFALSHEQPLIKNQISKLERLDLRLGVQSSLIQRRLSGDHFIYSSQLDPIAGLIDNYTSLGLRSRLFPNLHAGAMLRGYYVGKKNRDVLYTIGYTLSNVNQPNESLLGAVGTANLPMRTTLHAGITQRITRYRGTKVPLYMAPQFRWDRQVNSKLNLQTIGTYFFSKGFYTGIFMQYNFPNELENQGPTIIAGNFFSRNTTTLILNSGIDIRSVLDRGVPWRKRGEGILLGFSYDINLAGLQYQNTLGVVEFSLRMNFSALNPNRKCGEIGKFELYKGDCPIRF